MKKLLFFPLAFLLACQGDTKCAKPCPVITVKFSPNGGAEEEIVSTIDQAKKRILVQCYSFTAMPIAHALGRAKRRQVRVIVIADPEIKGNPNSVLSYLKESHITVYFDRKHAIAHNKIMVIDDDVTLTGSYNWSTGANIRNSENSIKIIDKDINQLYYKNWEDHRAHSELDIE